MTKVNIKYEKFTHSCGFFFTNKAFKAFALGKITSIYFIQSIEQWSKILT